MSALSYSHWVTICDISAYIATGSRFVTFLLLQARAENAYYLTLATACQRLIEVIYDYDTTG